MITHQPFGSPQPQEAAASGGGIGFGEIGLGMGIGSSIANIFATARQAEMQKAMANEQARLIEFNAEMSLKQIEDIYAQADFQTRKIGQRGAQVQGAQRASLAAQGIGIDTGSAAELQKETAQLTTDDMMMVRQNALKAAFGVKANAYGMQMQANLVRAGGQASASGTLLTGGINAGTQLVQNYANYSAYRYAGSRQRSESAQGEA